MRRATLIALLLLSACGQSGDLYLPDESAAPPPAPAEPVSTDREDAKKEQP